MSPFYSKVQILLTYHANNKRVQYYPFIPCQSGVYMKNQETSLSESFEIVVEMIYMYTHSRSVSVHQVYVLSYLLTDRVHITYVEQLLRMYSRFKFLIVD